MRSANCSSAAPATSDDAPGASCDNGDPPTATPPRLSGPLRVERASSPDWSRTGSGPVGVEPRQSHRGGWCLTLVRYTSITAVVVVEQRRVGDRQARPRVGTTEGRMALGPGSGDNASARTGRPVSVCRTGVAPLTPTGACSRQAVDLLARATPPQTPVCAAPMRRSTTEVVPAHVRWGDVRVSRRGVSKRVRRRGAGWSSKTSSGAGSRPPVVCRSALRACVDPLEDGVADPGQLLHIVGGEGVEHEPADGLDVAGGGGDDLVPPASVSTARVARASPGWRRRVSQPRCSRRATTWDTRDSEALACPARWLSRRARSGASLSRAMT